MESSIKSILDFERSYVNVYVSMCLCGSKCLNYERVGESKI